MVTGLGTRYGVQYYVNLPKGAAKTSSAENI